MNDNGDDGVAAYRRASLPSVQVPSWLLPLFGQSLDGFGFPDYSSGLPDIQTNPQTQPRIRGM